jgi:thiosulfate dehydrogenase
MSDMGKFLVGVILGVIIVPLAFYLYCKSGRAPAAAADPPLPMEKAFARAALHAAIDNRAPKAAPIQSDESNLVAGAHVYRDNCAVCHGLPGEKAPAMASLMFPKAPQLFEKKEMVTDDPSSETYWKAKNGIRLSGMPGFQKVLTDEQLWQVSLVLAGADKLPPAAEQVLTAPAAASADATHPAQ